MKLLTFQPKGKSGPRFGVLLEGFAVSFAFLQERFNRNYIELANIYAYLQGLPESENLARALAGQGAEMLSSVGPGEKYTLDEVKILPAIPHPPALFDFGLSPKHLQASALTMNKYERKGLTRVFADLVVKRQFRKMGNRPRFRFYKGNHNSIIGDQESPIWPSFTSYLDIEPELGVVAGKAGFGVSREEIPGSIAGYVIFNDFSARDIQFREMLAMLGPSRSKDFERGNGLGPFLVTPDEVPHPLSLRVTVKVGEQRYLWQGTTAEYSAPPGDVITYLTRFRSLVPGTIIGMGTVPGCCGLDRDEWIRPGEMVEIDIEKLGKLRHPIPFPTGPLKPTRWPARKELVKD